MQKNGIRFYQLNTSKRYGVEGTNFKIGETILLGVVLSIFLALAIAQIVINFHDLFRDVRLTVFVFVFLAIVLLIAIVAFFRYAPVIQKRKRARKILKDCTLTDGTVLEVHKQKMQHTGTNLASNYTYYLVQLKYSFYGTDRTLRYGEFQGNYGDIPFYVGQNLMIAFHDTIALS